MTLVTVRLIIKLNVPLFRQDGVVMSYVQNGETFHVYRQPSVRRRELGF